MMEEKELFLEWVDNTIGTYEQAPREVTSSGQIVISFGMLKELSSLVPKELKYKKGVPTVIEYQRRRYVLDHADNRK